MLKASGARTARETIINNSGLAQLHFMKTVSLLLVRNLDCEKQMLTSMKQELASLEDGILHIHKRNGNAVFCKRIIGSNKEFGISKDISQVHHLARRAYLEKCITTGELHIKKMQRIIDASDFAMEEARMLSKFARYNDAGLDLSRILFTEEQNDWMDRTYTPNPFYQENLNYETQGRILMRSKSEAMIGSFLERIGLPYRSDDLVNIVSDNNTKQPYRDNYFADFKVPNLLGGITIHEHFGAFQIENYSQNALQRLNDYHSFQVIEIPGRPVQSDEFTWSFECDLMQAGTLEKLIYRMLLPGLYN